MIEQWARAVPCEIEGDVMYAAGMVLVRGRQVGVASNGEPIYEWLPRDVGSKTGAADD